MPEFVNRMGRFLKNRGPFGIPNGVYVGLSALAVATTILVNSPARYFDRDSENRYDKFVRQGVYDVTLVMYLKSLSGLCGNKEEAMQRAIDEGYPRIAEHLETLCPPESYKK